MLVLTFKKMHKKKKRSRDSLTPNDWLAQTSLRTLAHFALYCLVPQTASAIIPQAEFRYCFLPFILPFFFSFFLSPSPSWSLRRLNRLKFHFLDQQLLYFKWNSGTFAVEANCSSFSFVSFQFSLHFILSLFFF